MPKKTKNTKTKQSPPIGKQKVENKNEFYTKHKNTIWTIVVLIILTLFFIVNNTRKIPEHGPYPPNYLNGNSAN